jgi:hypothetical protein
VHISRIRCFISVGYIALAVRMEQQVQACDAGTKYHQKYHQICPDFARCGCGPSDFEADLPRFGVEVSTQHAGDTSGILSWSWEQRIFDPPVAENVSLESFSYLPNYTLSIAFGRRASSVPADAYASAG